MQPIKPFIWFNDQAEAAMNFYAATFPNSRIVHIERYTGDQGIPNEAQLKGKVLTGTFEVNGLKFQCLDGGPFFELTSGISFIAEFDKQDDLDKVWDALMKGGKPQQCGWITDKFGVTWQILPTVLGKLMSDPHATPAQKQAVTKAMMPMVKMEAAQLQAAFDKAK